jgi:hypothetical protein
VRFVLNTSISKNSKKKWRLSHCLLCCRISHSSFPFPPYLLFLLVHPEIRNAIVHPRWIRAAVDDDDPAEKVAANDQRPAAWREISIQSWAMKRQVRSCFTFHCASLNPIEPAFGKFKSHLRKAAERTIPRLLHRIGRVVRNLSPQECRNFFQHAGCVRTWAESALIPKPQEED